MNYWVAPGLIKKYIITPAYVFELVCKYFGYETDYIIETRRNRKREFVEIRQLTMFFMRENIKGMSYALIASHFFNQDHATALHACKTIKNIRKTDLIFRDKTQRLFDLLMPEE